MITQTTQKPIWSSLLLGIALCFATAQRASAQSCPMSPPSCTDTVAIPNPVYVMSGDTQVPALHRLGKLLRAQTESGSPAPTTIVYIPNGSCTNLANIYATPMKFTPGTGGGPFYIPADPNFDVAAKTACPCTIPQEGIVPDLANTIVAPDTSSCPTLAPKPANISVFKGPVQAMVFVVPYDAATNAGSSQRAITAEEAFLVLGLGPQSAMVPPWNDPNLIFGRPASKGTQVSIGANIGVPAAKWKLLTDAGHTIDQSSTLASTIAALAGQPTAEQALGILGTEIYDKTANRAKMRALAFRAFKQQRAYWPDKTSTTFDKQNVRDGHYSLWSFVQYVAPVNEMGKALKPAAQKIIDAFIGTPIATTPAFEPLDVAIDSGLVPICAMKVTRDAEGGPLAAYSSQEPCGCYFEKKAVGSTTCTVCDANTPCATGTCRHGYCEAR